MLIKASLVHPHHSAGTLRPSVMVLWSPTLLDSDHRRTEQGGRNFYLASEGTVWGGVCFDVVLDSIFSKPWAPVYWKLRSSMLISRCPKGLVKANICSASILCSLGNYIAQYCLQIWAERPPCSEPLALDSLNITDIKLQRIWECFLDVW